MSDIQTFRQFDDLILIIGHRHRRRVTFTVIRPI